MYIPAHRHSSWLQFSVSYTSIISNLTRLFPAFLYLQPIKVVTIRDTEVSFPLSLGKITWYKIALRHSRWWDDIHSASLMELTSVSLLFKQFAPKLQTVDFNSFQRLFVTGAWQRCLLLAWWDHDSALGRHSIAWSPSVFWHWPFSIIYTLELRTSFHSILVFCNAWVFFSSTWT